jgi:hypothetical protein
VLGKIIGVYLGRPFEGWEHKRIISELGEIYYYVNERRDLPLKNNTLVVTDDDISGTFTFLRALPDYVTAWTSPWPRSGRPGSTTSSSGARSCGGEVWAIRPSTPHI